MSTRRLIVLGGALTLVLMAVETYRLYRPPAVSIVRLEPSAVFAHRTQRGRLHGTGFRPYLRARVVPLATTTWQIIETPGLMMVRRPGITGDTHPAAAAFTALSFVTESPERAEFQVPPLPPGTYDVVLHDDVREVARLERGLTVGVPPALVAVRGRFLNLSEAEAAAIQSGTVFPPATWQDWGRVESIGARALTQNRWEVPATVTLRCVREAAGCMAGDTLASAGAEIMVLRGDGWNGFVLRIDAVVAP